MTKIRIQNITNFNQNMYLFLHCKASPLLIPLWIMMYDY